MTMSPSAESASPKGSSLNGSAPNGSAPNGSELDRMLEELRGFMSPQGNGRPMFPGAVVLVVRDGTVVLREAMGLALRYADAEGTLLPAGEQVEMRLDSIFDMASVSKLFTSIVVMQLVERGLIELERPVAAYLPAFAANGKAEIIVRDLLTHTSGVPAWKPLWSGWPDKATRIAATLDVEPTAPRDTRYTYSDLNLITLGVLVEKVSGESLDALVSKGITEPLGMTDTGYNPAAGKLWRIAATEFQADASRGMVRGEVHDENAWSLGGIAGHAGIFSTASDMSKLCQAVLDGGALDGGSAEGGGRILREETVEQMLTDHNQAFPGHAHGLGFELDQSFYMGDLSSPRTAGHTGFTGTSVVIDRDSRTFVILLTNRVHARREWSSVNVARRLVARRVSHALKLDSGATTSWFAATRTADRTADPTADRAAGPAILTAPLTIRQKITRLAFDLFVVPEDAGILNVELSRDSGASWRDVPFVSWSRGRLALSDNATLVGRVWQHGLAELDEGPGEALLRWRFEPDSDNDGEGAYLGGILVADGDGRVLDGELDRDRFVTVGWEWGPMSTIDQESVRS